MVDQAYNIDKASILSKLNQKLGNGGEPVRDLMSLEDIKGKTIISSEERMLLSQLRFMANKFDIPIIHEFLQDYEEYGISVNGLSRTQFVAVHTQPQVNQLNLPQDPKQGELNTGNRKL